VRWALESTTDNGSASAVATPAAPSSASEALNHAASAASSAAAPEPSAPASAGPTSAAIGQAPAQELRGPIPYDRHEAALKNAREKAEADYKAKFAWAERYQPHEVESLTQLRDRLQGLRPDLLRQIAAEFASPSQTPPEPEEVDPEPDLETQDGRTKAFSADQARKLVNLNVKRAIAEIRRELAPVQQFMQAGQQREQQAQIETWSKGQASAVMQRMSTLPGFTEHQAEIQERMQQVSATNPQLIQDIGAVAAFQQVYLDVLSEKVLPTYGTRAETKVLDDLKRKAHAETGSHVPGTGAVAAKTAPRNESELAALLRQRFSEAGA